MFVPPSATPITAALFFINLPVVPSNLVKPPSVAEAGPTTSPVPEPKTVCV